MSNYRRGADFERKVQDWYEDQGYFVVRAAGSHGPVDLVVLSKKQPSPSITLIQCKTDGKISFTDEQMLAQTGRKVHASLVLVVSKRKKGSTMLTPFEAREVIL